MLWNSCGAARSQSIDQNNPEPISDSEIKGSDELRGQTYYYSLDASAGDLKISADCSTEYQPTNLRVVVTDESGVEIKSIALVGTAAGTHYTGSLRFSAPKRIIVRLHFPLNGGDRIKYDIRFGGAS